MPDTVLRVRHFPMGQKATTAHNEWEFTVSVRITTGEWQPQYFICSKTAAIGSRFNKTSQKHCLKAQISFFGKQL